MDNLGLDAGQRIGDDLKLWTDKWRFTAKVKNGHSFLRPEAFIVTSNYHPRDIWSDPKFLAPLLERFDIREFRGVYVPAGPTTQKRMRLEDMF